MSIKPIFLGYALSFGAFACSIHAVDKNKEEVFDVTSCRETVVERLLSIVPPPPIR